VEHCERVHIIAAAKRICIANCRECIFYLGVNHQPLIVGDNHKLHVRFCYSFCCGQLVVSRTRRYMFAAFLHLVTVA
jgi:hypothetical protein